MIIIICDAWRKDVQVRRDGKLGQELKLQRRRIQNQALR
jgi:hypothetical protein